MNSPHLLITFIITSQHSLLNDLEKLLSTPEQMLVKEKKKRAIKTTTNHPTLLQCNHYIDILKHKYSNRHNNIHKLPCLVFNDWI